jgi:hypothetical protein
LAETPDISETFVREVDENLRRDQLRDMARKNVGGIVAAVVLFLAACGGFIYWQDYRAKQNAKAVDELAQVYTDISKDQLNGAPAKLDALSKSGSKGVRGSAELGRAVLALKQDDAKLALAEFKAIAADKSLPQPFRDLALVRQTALEFDSLKPEEVIARLAPLTKPDSAWFGSAGEMTAMAMFKQGKKADAGRLLAAIARDQKVPENIRSRTGEMASTLGVSAAVTARPAQ